MKNNLNIYRGGEIGSFGDLEKLTLARIRDVKPNR
jgi:hypothetical protein